MAKIKKGAAKVAPKKAAKPEAAKVAKPSEPKKHKNVDVNDFLQGLNIDYLVSPVSLTPLALIRLYCIENATKLNDYTRPELEKLQQILFEGRDELIHKVG